MPVNSWADVSYLSAFIAGLASFLTPCVLPLIPVYVSYLAGVSVSDLARLEKKQASALWLNGLCFIAGFSLVFIALGAGASSLGRFLLQNLTLAERIGGFLVFGFGLMLGGFIKLPWLLRSFRLKERLSIKGIGPLGSLMLGITFAFGWTPCVGPILGAILTLAASKQNLFAGMILLSWYALGLALPFMLVLLALQWSLPKLKKFQPYTPLIEKVSAYGLMLLGLLMLGGWFSRLSLLLGN
jgi:cytochrome c-type biogenesis protein